MSTTVAILCFYWHLYNQLFKVKDVLYLATSIYVGTLILQIFQSLEVVCRRSETQLQATENLN